MSAMKGHGLRLPACGAARLLAPGLWEEPGCGALHQEQRTAGVWASSQGCVGLEAAWAGCMPSSRMTTACPQAAAIGRAEARALTWGRGGLRKQGQHIGMALGGCQQLGRGAAAVGGRPVGTGVQQQLHTVDRPGIGGGVQGRVALPVPSIHRGARLQQRTHAGGLGVARSSMQREPPRAPLRGLHSRRVQRQQAFDLVRLTPLDGCMDLLAEGRERRPHLLWPHGGVGQGRRAVVSWGKLVQGAAPTL